LEINQRESSLLISTKSKITYLPGEFDVVETKKLETNLNEVIEPEFLDLDTLQPKVIQPKEPKLTQLINLGSSLSLPLPSTQPQHVYHGPNREPLPLGLDSIKEITKDKS